MLHSDRCGDSKGSTSHVRRNTPRGPPEAPLADFAPNAHPPRRRVSHTRQLGDDVLPALWTPTANNHCWRPSVHLFPRAMLSRNNLVSLRRSLMRLQTPQSCGAQVAWVQTQAEPPVAPKDRQMTRKRCSARGANLQRASRPYLEDSRRSPQTLDARCRRVIWSVLKCRKESRGGLALLR